MGLGAARMQRRDTAIGTDLDQTIGQIFQHATRRCVQGISVDRMRADHYCSCQSAFFKKTKNVYPSDPTHGTSRGPTPKSFLLLFFKKEGLTSLPHQSLQ
jgi:hypothetical protein